MVSDWIKNSGSIDMRRIAQDFAIDLVKERTFELGKQEWLVDPGAVRRSKPSASEAATSLSSRST